MPIVAHSDLPTFVDLHERGEPILSLDEALRQDIRELHIGLLNMMPDAALKVTERQFMQLVGGANQIVQVYVHPFTVPGLPRSAETQTYIDRYYRPFDELRREGLDAIIVSGANVANPRLEAEPFWEPLLEIIGWAADNVTSIMCSCLATHALVQHLHGVHRRPLQRKRWGVYPHRVVRRDHPLLYGINTRFDVPHSRWNEVTSAQLEAVGIQPLVESEEGDFHLGATEDGLRMVFMQGHPEYEINSLLKEYKREVQRFLAGDLAEVPPHPERYLTPAAARTAHRYLDRAVEAVRDGRTPPAFPDADLAEGLDNTWADTGRAVFNNWLGMVYRSIGLERGSGTGPGRDAAGGARSPVDAQP